MTPAEYEELLTLVDRIELLEAERVQCLADLAQLRGVAFSDLVDELGFGGSGEEPQ